MSFEYCVDENQLIYLDKIYIVNEDKLIDCFRVSNFVKLKVSLNKWEDIFIMNEKENYLTISILKSRKPIFRISKKDFEKMLSEGLFSEENKIEIAVEDSQNQVDYVLPSDN